MAAALLGEDAPEGPTTSRPRSPRRRPTPLPLTEAEPEAELERGRERDRAHAPDGARRRDCRTRHLRREPERPRRRPSKTALIVAGAILALVLITVLAIVAFTGPSTPPPDQAPAPPRCLPHSKTPLPGSRSRSSHEASGDHARHRRDPGELVRRRRPPGEFRDPLAGTGGLDPRLAEEGKPGLARTASRTSLTSVTSQLDRGRIEEGWAPEILESAQAVEPPARVLSLASRSRKRPAPHLSTRSGEEGHDGHGKDETRARGTATRGRARTTDGSAQYSCPRSHATYSGSPRSNGYSGLYPRSRAAALMSQGPCLSRCQ